MSSQKHAVKIHHIFFTLCICCYFVFSSPVDEQGTILLDLYHSTQGQFWINKWDTTIIQNNQYCNNTSTLYGLQCINKQIESIALNDNNLTGTLPSSICNLTKLTTLWLYSNGLTGTIPQS
eukprot:528802_1